MDIALEFRTWGISLHTYHEWQPLLGKLFPKRFHPFWNWIDITLIKLGFEHSPYKDSNEVFFGLLGFHGTLTLFKQHEPQADAPWIRFRNYGREEKERLAREEREAKENA